MIESNPSNVLSGFEMLSGVVEAERDFFKAEFPHGTWEISDAGQQHLKETV